MTQYTTLHDAFIAANDACKADGARSKSLVAAKNTAKAALLDYARELYAFVQASQAVTDADKVLIGVTVRDAQPTPVPPPSLSPMLTLLSVTGRVARYKVADRQFPASRRKPLNAEGVTIMSYVGATPPASDDPGWKLEGQTGKTTFLVQFPNDVAPGTACWVTALWYSRRGAYSPACDPVQTYLQVGPVSEAA